MNSISRNRVLISIIAILLLANVAMLIFIFSGNACPAVVNPKPPGFTDKLRNEVKFDSIQMATFEAKKKAHREKIGGLFDTMTRTKEDFYKQIYDPSIPDSLIEFRATVIGQQQKNLDLQLLGYFKDVRKLCTPEQATRYDSIVPGIIKKMIEFPRKK